jgi:hypothetical protein
MSVNVTLVVIGVVLCVIGRAIFGKSQSGGLSLSLRNLGINFGSKSTQNIRVGDVTAGDKKAKPNWVGLAITVIGFLTAVIGLFKTLSST